MHVPYVVASAETSGGQVVEQHLAKVEQQWVRHGAGEDDTRAQPGHCVAQPHAAMAAQLG
jgi:hypothetical protein